MKDESAPIDADALRSRYRDERDRRMTAGRDERAVLTGSLRRYLDDPYTPAAPRPARRETARVLIVGAGFGGLIMAARLREAGEDFFLVEEAGDVGGVWYWNRYPGASCDIDAYTYLPLLEETGYMPSERYARQEEIYGYARLMARKYGVYERALFHTAATCITWDHADGAWVTRTDRGDVIRSQFLVMAIGGAYSRPKLPAIPGVESFQGESFHSSRWDYGYTGGGPRAEMDKLRDKHVAIIGTGATAVQAVPWLARSAGQLYVVQRTPSAVAARNNAPTDPDWFAGLKPGWQRARQANFAALTSGEVVDDDLIEDGWSAIYHELLNPALTAGTPAAEVPQALELADFQKMEKLRQRVASAVKDPQVAESLKPYYRYLCKRPCFHDDYLGAFNRPNTRLLDTRGKGVEQVTGHGIVVNGTEYRVDCLIYATGFLTADTVYTSRLGFDITGPHGRSLAAKWKDGPLTYQGIMTHGFPNLFIFPDAQQQAATSFNFMHTLLESSTHAAYIISEVRKRGQQYVNARPDAEEAWVAKVVEHARDRDQFLASCTPGRFSNEGRLERRSPRAAAYPLKTNDFFRYWESWRREGDLRGLRLQPAGER